MTDPLGKTLGRNLSNFREAEGASKAEFAERLGVDLPYLERLEEGVEDPELRTVEELASRLGMEPLLLLEPAVRMID